MREDKDVLARAIGERLERKRACAIARLGLAVLVASAVLGGTMPAALAGTYTINDCPAAGASSDAGPLTPFGGPQGAKGSCAGGEEGWVGPRGGEMAPNTVDGVEVTAPGATTLRGAKIYWYVPRSSSGASTYALAGVNSGGIFESHTPLEQRGTPTVFTLPSGTTTLILEDFCSDDDMARGCSFGDSGAANLQVFGAQLTVEENQPPSGGATGGGLLAHEVLSGTQSISFTASDADSGVRKVELLVDGVLVGEEDYGASCPYTNFAACPNTESGSISWNTAAVADGRHGLELDAIDAANNSSVLYAGNFATESLPRVNAPESDSIVQGVAPAVTPSLAGMPAPATSMLPAELRLRGPSAITRSFARRALNVEGQLVGLNGQAVAGASLVVLEQPLGGALKVVGGVVTGPSGDFTAAIPAGPSRMIEIRPAPGSAYAASTARVQETVRAGVVLKITPQRTGPTGTIHLRGRVEGVVPKGGVKVDLLVHYHGAWVPFRGPWTNAAGHFETEYTFGGSVGRWPFQAEVPRGQEGLPYARGLSRVLVVRTS